MKPVLETRTLSVLLQDVSALTDVTVSIPEGAFVGILGPNGSGKTTLLRALHRAVAAQGGKVIVHGDDITTLEPVAIAREIAVVAQEHHIGFEYTTHDVVMMGRTPYQQGFAATTDEDEHLVAQALTAVGLGNLAHRLFDEMSGGERQRTLIARALVQQSAILLLDEPTNHLDIHFQLDILRRVRALKLTTVAALHDINLAAAWCDQLIVMQHGRVVAVGAPATVLQPALIAEVFRIKATPYVHPITGAHRLEFDPLDEE